MLEVAPGEQLTWQCHRGFTFASYARDCDVLLLSWSHASLPGGSVFFVVPLRDAGGENDPLSLRAPEGIVADWLRTQPRLRWTSLEEAREWLGQWEASSTLDVGARLVYLASTRAQD